MNLRPYIDIITEASRKTDLVDRSAFIYMDPKPGVKEFAQCGTCAHFMSSRERCNIFTDQFRVVKGASCGLYINGEPNDDQEFLNSITPKDAGYVVEEVRCENCVALSGTTCTFFDTLNKKLPDYFKLDTQVKPRGCCNAWAKK